MGDQGGEIGPTAVGVSVNPHTLRVASEAQVRGQVIPRLHPDEAAFRQMKARANAAASAAVRTEKPASSSQRATQSPGVEFPALDYNQTGRSFNPPDGGFAVGPTQEIEAVNSSWAIYGRTGGKLLGPISFNSFFSTSTTTFDPHVLYDAGNASGGGFGGGGARFAMVATTHDNVHDTAVFTLAVSQNDNPSSSTTGWCVYKFNSKQGTGTSATWSDFPHFGMDGNNFYISSNQFTFDASSFFGGNFAGSRVMVIPKSSVYPSATTGQCPAGRSHNFSNVLNPDGTHAYSDQPANQPGGTPMTSSTTMYFVNDIYGSGSKLALRSITTTAAGVPTLHSPRWVNVSPYSTPADAPQPNGSGILTDDISLRNAVYRYGTVYTTNTTRTVSGVPGANPYANVQWYAINPGRATAVTHDIYNPNVAYWVPGVVISCTVTTMPCPSPAVTLEFSGSGPSQPASAFYQTGSAAPAVFQQGVSGYTMTDAWGDYPGVTLDPTDPTSVWLLGEYAAQTSDWGTAAMSVKTSPSQNPRYKSAVLADGPVIYYRLDESSGTTAADSSGNGRDAAYTGNATLDQPGATSDGDSAITGSGTMVGYPSGAGLATGSAPRSVECWFKTTMNVTGSGVVLAAWGTEATTSLFALMLYSPTQVKVSDWNNDYIFTLPSSVADNDGTWHHVVATWDGSTLTSYFDGQPAGSVAATFNTVLNSSGLVAGASVGRSFQYSGAIDELAVYGTALSAAQVQNHYNDR